MRMAPWWKSLDYFQPGCGIPAGITAGLAGGNPVPGSEQSFSAEVPIQSWLQPGHGDKAGGC